MSSRRSRLAFRPNVAGPKARQTLPAAKTSTVKTTSEQDGEPVKTEDGKNSEKGAQSEIVPSEAITVPDQTVSTASVDNSIGKPNSTKTVSRRAISKPKPNILSRGTVKNKHVENTIDSNVKIDEHTLDTNNEASIDENTIESNAKISIDEHRRDSMVKKNINEHTIVSSAKNIVASRVSEETTRCKDGEINEGKQEDDKNVTQRQDKERDENTPQKSQVETNIASEDKSTVADEPKNYTKQAPSRFRSRFTKARPNVEALSRPRIRHPSLSESDNFPIKEPPPVQRVVTLNTNESTTNLSSLPKVSDGIAINKETVDIRKTPLKTIAKDDHKETQIRKRKKLLILEEPVDRSRLKMKDLIYMNPKSNPMKTVEEERKVRKESFSGALSPEPSRRNRKASTTSNKSSSSNRVKIGPDGQIILDDDEEPEKENCEETEEDQTDNNKNEDCEDAIPAPQVTIGADGEIILNEASLVLDNPYHKATQEDMELVHETNDWTTSSSQYGYRKKKRVKQWTENETKKFYLALNAIGTDFSLMLKLFPERTRPELKRKFRKEEKISKHLVDKAIKDRYQFEKDLFEELYELDKLDEKIKEGKEKKRKVKEMGDEKKVKVKAEKRKRPASNPKVKEEAPSKKKKKGKKKLYVESDSDSGDEQVPVADTDIEVHKPEEELEEVPDEVQLIADMQARPLRSGRTIKSLVLGQTGASHTAKTSESEFSPVMSPKPSTEIRIRRISGTSSTPCSGIGRVRTLSTSSQGSTGSINNKAPGQFLALSNISQSQSASTEGPSDMQPGSLVFVQSNSSTNEKGEVTPGLVHIYMVSSPPPVNTPPVDAEQAALESPSIPPLTVLPNIPSTPGGFKSNQFSLIETTAEVYAQKDTDRPHHSPSILKKSPQGTASMPHQKQSDLSGNSVSATLLQTQTLLETHDSAVLDTEIKQIEGTEIIDLQITDESSASKLYAVIE